MIACPGYLLTSRVEGPVLWAMDRHEAQWYFNFHAADLQARWNLNLLCEKLLNEGNKLGAAILWNAFQYLIDRDRYVRDARHRPLGRGMIYCPDGLDGAGGKV